MCNNSGLLGTLTLVKRVLLLIQIIVPIILIGAVIVSLIKLLKNPEEQNGTKKIINQFIAAVIVFFIPLLVNVVMNIAGDNTNFSSCWNSASDKITLNSGYIEYNEKERKKITYDAKDYEKGIASGNLDFSCISKTVKSQFSCETLKIVEKHLYDLNADNFHYKINKYGGFDKYAKSLGGIFGEYYGKKMPHETVADFQRACEYVLGWMYMYGWDYNFFEDNEGLQWPWGDKNYDFAGDDYSDDAFYYNTKNKSKGRYIPDYNFDSAEFWWYGTDFDGVISTKSQGGSVGRMSSACGDFSLFVYNKLDLKRLDGEVIKKNITRLKDLKVGDSIAFFNDANAKDGDLANHLAMVGEVYDDRVVIYDASGAFQSHKNYKHIVMIPKEDSREADKKAVKDTYYGWFNSWNGSRHYDFK